MNSNTTIKKIKIIESTGKIEIDCIRRGEQGEDEVKGLFAEPAAPEFYDAMKALTVPGANILEAPELAARLVPFAVTYHYDKDDTMGAIITMKLKLPESKTETVINTPMRKCAKSDNPKGAVLTATAARALWNLEAEARKYLCGKRAQTNLFDDAAGQADDEAKQFSGDLHVIQFGSVAREA